mgnify:CR=1 FL=1
MAAQGAGGGDAVEFALSSEAPYERWFGIEILDHSPAAVDLTRLSDGRHPLLLNHDPERQIGVIEKAWLDVEAKAGRVLSRSNHARLREWQGTLEAMTSQLKAMCDEHDPDKGEEEVGEDDDEQGYEGVGQGYEELEEVRACVVACVVLCCGLWSVGGRE